MLKDPIKINKGVYLFKNALNLPDKAYSFAKNSKNEKDEFFNDSTWQNWLTWGNQSGCYVNQTKQLTENFDSYNNSDSITGIDLQRECTRIFFETLEYFKNNEIDNGYFDRYGFDKNIPTNYLELNEKQYSLGDFVLFEAKHNNQNDWHMRPHQDNHKWWGTYRQVFNCNIYLNDDFKGGEIEFYEYNGKTVDYVDCYSNNPGKAWVMENCKKYTIEAGDALLIETDAWHGVLPMLSGSKYYVRQLLSYNMPTEDMIRYQQTMTKDEYELFYKNESKKYSQLRISPIKFDSLNEIDIDAPRYSEETSTVVPFILENSLQGGSL
jgi:hypothetical protein